jgi:hypothetical protein
MSYRRAILLLAAAAAVLSLAACAEETRDPVRTYNIGDRVDLGHIVYTVFETQWLTHIGEGPDASVPRNRFFLVRISAANRQRTEILLPKVSLQDDSGHSYPELSADVGAPHWVGVLRTVMANDSTQGNVVFDAPPGHYRLKVTDDTGDRFAYIDIPLSFGAETPEVTLPGIPRPPSMPPIRSPDAPVLPKKQ